jgi:hypothetical protein
MNTSGNKNASYIQGKGATAAKTNTTPPPKPSRPPHAGISKFNGDNSVNSTTKFTGNLISAKDWYENTILPMNDVDREKWENFLTTLVINHALTHASDNIPDNHV